MSKRYIDANKFAKRLNASPVWNNMGADEYLLRGVVNELLEIQPTADVVEVRHGEWIKPKNRVDTSDWKECSRCGYYFDVSVGQEVTPYCPECGAKMDGERKEE